MESEEQTEHNKFTTCVFYLIQKKNVSESDQRHSKEYAISCDPPSSELTSYNCKQKCPLQSTIYTRKNKKGWCLASLNLKQNWAYRTNCAIRILNPRQSSQKWAPFKSQNRTPLPAWNNIVSLNTHGGCFCCTTNHKSTIQSTAQTLFCWRTKWTHRNNRPTNYQETLITYLARRLMQTKTTKIFSLIETKLVRAS